MDNPIEQVDILLAKMASGLRKKNPDGVTDGIISILRQDIVKILESQEYSEQEALTNKVFERLDRFIKSSYSNGMDLSISCSAVELKNLISEQTRLSDSDPHSVEGFIAALMASINDEDKKKEIEISEREEGSLKSTVIQTHGLNGIFSITLAYQDPSRIQMIMLGGAVRRLAESFSGKFYGLPCRIYFQDTERLYGYLNLQVLY